MRRDTRPASWCSTTEARWTPGFTTWLLRLRTELGDNVAQMIVNEAEKMPESYPLIRRVTVLAEKL
jgi:hypothetical protein